MKLNDHSTAIQFLVLSQCHQEAYKLAEQHDKMEIYAEVLGNEGNTETYEMMARYFEKQRKSFLSGKFYYLAGHYSAVRRSSPSRNRIFIVVCSGVDSFTLERRRQ